MSLHRFFLDKQVLANETDSVFPLQLTTDDLKHFKVLRFRVGEHIAVIDAASDYFECEICSVADGYPQVCISKHSQTNVGWPQVMLVQGLAKGDKMDTIIRHATELGVAAFYPFAAERSIVKLDSKKATKRHERWEAIAKSAAMQSGQSFIPEVLTLGTISDICEAISQATAVVICWEEAPLDATLSSAVRQGVEACKPASPQDVRIAIVVGPEGGLTQAEVDALLSCNPRASIASLGPSILRTETAGIVVPALVLYELGQLGSQYAGGSDEVRGC